ncbi:MAG TPA: DNA repair exonuclease [Bacillota bacterium]
MPTFLHIADVHLDARLRFLGERGREHRANIRAAFTRCIDLALERRVDALLIAGDLFDSQRPGRGTVEFVREQFQRLGEAGIAVRIVPGTHDALTPSGVYRWANLESAGNVRVYRGEGPDGWDVEQLTGGLTVYARPTLEKGGGLSALKGLPRDGSAQPGCEVALVHATLDLGSNDDEDYILHPAEVAASGLAYIAAGHWHTPRSFGHNQTEGRYPGSPEPVSLDPRRVGQALVVTLTPGQRARVEPVEVGRIRVDLFDFDVTGHEDEQPLETEIARMADPDLMLRVRLRGTRGPGWTRTAEDLAAAFSGSFFHLTVEDASTDLLASDPLATDAPASDPLAATAADDDPAPAGLPAGTAAARFAQRLQQRLADAASGGDETTRRRLTEALRLGLALFAGRDPW